MTDIVFGVEKVNFLFHNSPPSKHTSVELPWVSLECTISILDTETNLWKSFRERGFPEIPLGLRVTTCKPLASLIGQLFKTAMNISGYVLHTDVLFIFRC